MANKKSWDEFRRCGALRCVNHTLHPIGWAIVLDMDEGGNITSAYPARVEPKSFREEAEAFGFGGAASQTDKDIDESFAE